MSFKSLSHEEAVQKIINLEDLPTLPAVAQRVIDLAQSENVDFKELKKIIITDPPLTARVLRVANSSFYGRRLPARTVEDALVTLGIHNLLAICNTIGILKSFDIWQTFNFSRAELWRHSLATAFLAKSLEFRKMLNLEQSPDLFLCGLVHNIGWIIYDHLFSPILAAALTTAREVLEWTLEIERSLMGINHAEAGAIFLRKWGLPEDVCEVVQYHHNPNQAGELASFSGILQIAAALSPHRFALDLEFDRVCDKVPHFLENTEGNAALLEMHERYDTHIRQAGVMADLLLEWL